MKLKAKTIPAIHRKRTIDMGRFNITYSLFNKSLTVCKVISSTVGRKGAG